MLRYLILFFSLCTMSYSQEDFDHENKLAFLFTIQDLNLHTYKNGMGLKYWFDNDRNMIANFNRANNSFNHLYQFGLQYNYNYKIEYPFFAYGGVNYTFDHIEINMTKYESDTHNIILLLGFEYFIHSSISFFGQYEYYFAFDDVNGLSHGNESRLGMSYFLF